MELEKRRQRLRNGGGGRKWEHEESDMAVPEIAVNSSQEIPRVDGYKDKGEPEGGAEVSFDARCVM
jgi:hypothetical protein